MNPVGTELKFGSDEGVLHVVMKNDNTDYLFWRKAAGDAAMIYFEYNDKNGSGFSVANECIVDDDGCIVNLVSGDTIVFNFCWPLRGDFDALFEILENIYRDETEKLVDARGFYRRNR